MKTVLSFAVGAAVGAAATYILLKNKFEKQAQDDINEMRTEFKKRGHALLEELQSDLNDVLSGTEETSNVEEGKKIFSSSIAQDKRPINEIVDYSGYSKTNKKGEKVIDDYYEEGEEDLDYLESESEVPPPREGLADHQYPITEEQFSNEYLYYDKYTWLYYEGNDTLVSEDDEIMNDEIHNTVGDHFLDYIGKEEPDTAYIRNERISSDFQIIRLNSPYYIEGDA